MTDTDRPTREQRRADSAHGRFNERTAGIAAALRNIAEAVERDGKVRDTRHGHRRHSLAASDVQHAVLWGLANLDLDGLTATAAEADAAQRDADAASAPSSTVES